MPIKRSSLIILAAAIFHIFILSSLKFQHLDPLFNDSTYRHGKGNDFFVFYQSGNDLLNGRSIYPARFARQEQGLALAVPYCPMYRYPPIVAGSVGVLANLVRPWTAYWIWVCLTELSLLAVFLYSIRLLRRRGRNPALASLWLFYTPFYIDIYMGQPNTILSVLLFVVFVSLVENKPRRMALSWIPAILLKLNLLVLAPILVLKKWTRLLLAGLAALVVTSAPYFAFFPREATKFLAYALSPGTGFNNAGNLGFQSFLYVLVKSTTFAQFSQVVIILCALILTFHKSARRQRERARLIVELSSLWILVYFLAFKFVWEHHYMLLLPVLFFLLVEFRRKFLFVLYVWLALPTPFVFLDIGPGPEKIRDPQLLWDLPTSAFYHSFKVLPVVVLTVWLVSRRVKEMACLREEG